MPKHVSPELLGDAVKDTLEKLSISANAPDPLFGIATASKVGVVKPGDTMSIAADGTIDVVSAPVKGDNELVAGSSELQEDGTLVPPPSFTPKPGDTYVNTTTGEVYKYTEVTEPVLGEDGQPVLDPETGQPVTQVVHKWVKTNLGDVPAKGGNEIVAGSSYLREDGTLMPAPPFDPKPGDTYINSIRGEVYRYAEIAEPVLGEDGQPTIGSDGQPVTQVVQKWVKSSLSANIATIERVGIVKPGYGLGIDSDGTLYVSSVITDAIAEKSRWVFGEATLNTETNKLEPEPDPPLGTGDIYMNTNTGEVFIKNADGTYNKGTTIVETGADLSESGATLESVDWRQFVNQAETIRTAPLSYQHLIGQQKDVFISGIGNVPFMLVDISDNRITFGSVYTLKNYTNTYLDMGQQTIDSLASDMRSSFPDPLKTKISLFLPCETEIYGTNTIQHASNYYNIELENGNWGSRFQYYAQNPSATYAIKQNAFTKAAQGWILSSYSWYTTKIDKPDTPEDESNGNDGLTIQHSVNTSGSLALKANNAVIGIAPFFRL